MTPEEWSWLEAYRSEYGLPEDRLRHYFAIAITLLSPIGKSLSIEQVRNLLDPFRDSTPKKSSTPANEETQVISPNQHAALISGFIASRSKKNAQ